jgi:predicted Co/Zn/Cd cation transporter (cation efflux family)
MTTAKRPPNRGLTAIDGAIALIAVLLIVQMWLLTATLETFLAGHREPALPAAIFSMVLFGACFGLYLFIERVDRASQRLPR